MTGNDIPARWLDEHNRLTAEYIAQCRIERFIEKEFGDED